MKVLQSVYSFPPNNTGSCWPFLSQLARNIKSFKTDWTPVDFVKTSGWSAGKDPMPFIQEYLEYEVNYVLRYWRIHIQQSCWSSQLQGLNSDSQHFGHRRDQYTQNGKRGNFSAVPSELCSGLFSGNSLVEVHMPGAGIVGPCFLHPWKHSFLKLPYYPGLREREWAANTTSNIWRTCLGLMPSPVPSPDVSGCSFHLSVCQDPTTNLPGQQQTQPAHVFLNSTLI